ncbi:MAG: hypothetical protein QOE55_8589 [Acidobacteriaceae bacterium]|jgi:hypothetical protein|nr:hypothetical protein [Acidobacteriaceae bacterium]
MFSTNLPVAPPRRILEFQFMPLGMLGHLCANHGPPNVFIVHSLTREVNALATRNDGSLNKSAWRFLRNAIRPDVRVARKLLTAPPSQSFFAEPNTFPCKSVSIECVRSRLKKILKGRALSCSQTRSAPCAQRSISPGARPRREGRDACMQSTLGGSVPPWHRSFSMETYVGDEQP